MIPIVAACGGAGPAGPDSSSDVWFTDVSSGSGIDLHNVCGDPERKTHIVETLGSGAAAIDFDRDGLLDLFVVNGDALPGMTPVAAPRPALYRNLGDFRFADVTQEAGLLFRAFAHGATAVDFDSDGHRDLYITTFLGPNKFMRNRGDGTFEDVTQAWGGGDTGPSTAAAFFDADADGDLDLYVGAYVPWEPDNPPNHGQPCRWRGLLVVCGPRGTTAAPNSFFENRDGRLQQATHAFGFAAVEPSYTLGTVTGDFDNDGDIDLYVANDSEPNYHFENLGDGRFRDVGLESGTDRNEDGRAQAGMGVDVGDVDNDGRFEIFVTNFSHDTNTLYHNLLGPGGRTLFQDLTYAANLGLDSFRMLSWGTSIVDLDHDGWQDLVVVSGHIYPEVTEDSAGATFEQASQVFFNEGLSGGGPVSFRPFEPQRGDAIAKAGVSRSLVTADLDNDGDADFLIVEMDAPPILIRNDVPRRGEWIGLALRGVAGNVEAIGARITIEDSSGVRRWRERASGAGYLSSNDPRIVVGLGDADGPARVSVRWPSGRSSTFEGLLPGRYWTLDASSPEAVVR